MTYEIKLNTNRETTPEGLLISNVKILAVGKWNNVNYTIDELEKATWRDSIIWDRHFENEERDHTNIVGHIQNKHIIDNSIVGDILISNKSESGIETINLIENEDVRGVSVEHLSNDYTVNGQIYASDIQMLGAAIVQTPACTICTLSKRENNFRNSIEENKMTEEEIQDLTDKIAELTATVSELQKVDIDAALTEQMRKSDKVIAELSQRIKELEEEPVVNTTVVSNLIDSYVGIITERGETFMV